MSAPTRLALRRRGHRLRRPTAIARRQRTGAGTQGLRRARATGRFARPSVHPGRNPGRGLGPPAHHPERTEPDHEPAAPGVGEDAQRPRLLHTVTGSATASIGPCLRRGLTGSLRTDVSAPVTETLAANAIPTAAAQEPVRRRWLALVAAATLLALMAAAWLPRKDEGAAAALAAPDHAPAVPAQPSLAVLPFADLSGHAIRNIWPTAWPRKSSTSWRRLRRCGWWDAHRASRSRARTKTCAPSAGNWASHPAGRQRP